MSKYLIQLAVVFSLAFFVPTGSAQAALIDQHTDVFNALEVVIDDFEAEIAAAQATLATLPAGSQEANLLIRAIQRLQNRLSVAQFTQSQVFSLSAASLDSLIIRYSLPVSLS